MTKKLNLLVDAVVAIDANKIDCWNYLCSIYNIFLPSYILENEIIYFKSDRKKISLNPHQWLKNGKITRIEGSISEDLELSIRLKSDFLASLDPGEREAIAILASKRGKDYKFTTADKPAFKALAILGIQNSGISVEELLKDNKNYKKKYLRNIQKSFLTWLLLKVLLNKNYGFHKKIDFQRQQFSKLFSMLNMIWIYMTMVEVTR